jgi:hypothetical protein
MSVETDYPELDLVKSALPISDRCCAPHPPCIDLIDPPGHPLSGRAHLLARRVATAARAGKSLAAAILVASSAESDFDIRCAAGIGQLSSCAEPRERAARPTNIPSGPCYLPLSTRVRSRNVTPVRRASSAPCGSRKLRSSESVVNNSPIESGAFDRVMENLIVRGRHGWEPHQRRHHSGGLRRP